MQLVGRRVGASVHDDGLARNIAELAKAPHESVLPPGLGPFVGQTHIANSRHLPRRLGVGREQRGEKDERKDEAAEMEHHRLGGPIAGRS